MMPKTCSKCGAEKAFSEFNKDARRRDGLQSCCKVCKGVTDAKWQSANPEKVKANGAKWYAANSEKMKATTANWYATNPDKAKATVAKWKVSHPEAARIYKHNRRARKLEAGGALSQGLAEKLFKLQRGKCACGCAQPLGANYHRDHIMPLALGGSNEDWNIQLLRSTCNQQKHAKHPVDFMQSRGFLI